jgi:HSP20 family protein
MINLRNVVDRMYENTYGQRGIMRPGSWGLALDIAESEDEFVVEASLPGIDPDDLEITYAEGMLTIKGEVQEDQEIDEEQYHLRERRYGSFCRSITLSSKVKAEDIDAIYEKGVLALTLPKAEEVKPKRIEVKVHSPKIIVGKAKDKE